MYTKYSTYSNGELRRLARDNPDPLVQELLNRLPAKNDRPKQESAFAREPRPGGKWGRRL